ncbi:hypothetical protein SEUCBS140593_003610 [Sporothrix eucalyptigena]|uniref:non-specific serine/threonine protein kinase n=1 Tax=Sporothrix eucalyptigena TaxID=1812306 RepID=A0ABP0BGK3_9PEZI
MAAAGWNRRPGAGPSRAAAGVAGDVDAYTSSLNALRELASAVPGYAARLQTKEQLDAKQRTLIQSRGSVEQIGMSTEQVQLRVSDRVGEGTFCVVFRGELVSGRSAKAKGRAVAAKFELRKNDATQLRNEFRMYKKLDKCDGIPRIYTFGEMDFHKVLVMDLLGPTLENLFQDCGRRFSLKTVTMLAKQMITRIETLHQHDLIYRDIKPENFLMGLPETDAANSVYLIDYGMAKVYRDPDTNKHIPYGDAQSLSGTARYMSINAHCKRNQSRRDDLEALGHVFMYFARGNLPWQGVKSPQNDARYDLMCEKKQATTIDDLCRGFPPEMAQYLTYTRGLAFDEDPDYDYLRSLFTKILEDEGAVDDGIFDWIQPKVQQEVEVSGKKTERPITPNTASPAPISQPAAKPTTGVQVQPPFAQIAEQPRPKTAEENDETLQRPKTPPQVVGASSGHRALIVVPPPASPPGGKRRRSEFASDLRPPIRSIRPKKSAYAFYDSDAQRALATLYRDVMAGRYNFHRAVKQSRGGIASVAAAAALSARSAAAPGVYGRSMAPLRVMGGASVISPAFTEVLDKTLGQVISELEEMSDKLLQDGDWTGAPRVHGWLDEVSAAVQAEIERLEQEQEKDKQKHKEQQQEGASEKGDSSILAATTSAPSLLTGSSGLELEVDTDETAASQRKSGDLLAAEATIPPKSSTPRQQSSHSSVIFNPADPLEVDDAEGDDDDDDAALDEARLRARFFTRATTSLPRRMLGSPRVPAVSSVSSPAVPPLTRPYPGAGPDVLPMAPSSTDALTKPYSQESPSAAVRSGMGYLSLGVNDRDAASGDAILAADDDLLLADDDDDDEEGKPAKHGIDDKIDADDSTENEILELVYRTASGTRRVVRVADQEAQAQGRGGPPKADGF